MPELPDEPVRSFNILNLLAIFAFLNAAGDICFIGLRTLDWPAHLLMGSGFFLLSRSGDGNFKTVWRSPAGRAGTLLLIVALVLLAAASFVRR